MAAEIDEVSDELYGLDPGDFVAGRNDLARRLRKAGEREVAAEVAKLRRPSPAAWTVNQLVRRHRAEVEELVRLGEALRSAQDRALAGEESADLRQAGRARRDAVARLADRAAQILAERGGTPGAHAGEVVATLEAASLDEDAAAAVLGGRLSSELQPPSGFGAFDAPLPARPAARPQRERERGADPEPETEPDRRAVTEAEDAAVAARRQWEERSAKARAAVERVNETRRALKDAEAEVARLEDLLSDAERRRRAAVREAEHAEDAAGRAEDAAARAAERLREADQRLAELGGSPPD